MRFLLFSLLFLLWPVLSQAQVTQRDWALQLIDSLSWSFGLPKKPTDEDFLLVLNGSRIYRIEAEESFQRGDRVAVMKFDTFGEFSGEGWLNGTKNRTEAHLEFNLPHAGRYRITARVRLAEHHLKFGRHDFRMSGGDQFTNVEVGYVELPAGPQEAILQLRPNGSIDYFELEAAPAGPISPTGGWVFDAELTSVDAARTVLQALNLQKHLPPGQRVIKLEAENLPKPEGVRINRGNNKGKASGGRYLQVGAAPVTLGFYAANVSGGVADLILRAAGSRPIVITLPGYFDTRLQFGPRFEDRLLGTFFIPEGEMTIEVQLPAGASLDRLEIRSRRGSNADILRLVGLEESDRVTTRDLNNLSTLIYRLKELR